LPLALGDAYALSAERIQTHERIWESSGSLSADEPADLYIDVQEGGIEDPLFTLAWSGGSMADYYIEDPSGPNFRTCLALKCIVTSIMPPFASPARA